MPKIYILKLKLKSLLYTCIEKQFVSFLEINKLQNFSRVSHLKVINSIMMMKLVTYCCVDMKSIFSTFVKCYPYVLFCNPCKRNNKLINRCRAKKVPVLSGRSRFSCWASNSAFSLAQWASAQASKVKTCPGQVKFESCLSEG